MAESAPVDYSFLPLIESLGAPPSEASLHHQTSICFTRERLHHENNHDEYRDENWDSSPHNKHCSQLSPNTVNIRERKCVCSLIVGRKEAEVKRADYLSLPKCEVGGRKK